MKFERETRADLLQVRSGAILIELVSVMANEYEVSLVVEGHYSSLFKLRVLREQTCNHATDSVSEHRIEVIKNQLRGDLLHVGVRSVVRNF